MLGPDDLLPERPRRVLVAGGSGSGSGSGSGKTTLAARVGQILGLPLWTVFTDSGHIVRGAWSAHSRTAPRVRQLQERRPELVIVRLRTRAAVRRWCETVLVEASH
jgi:adenylate kinase family enzyme